MTVLNDSICFLLLLRTTSLIVRSRWHNQRERKKERKESILIARALVHISFMHKFTAANNNNNYTHCTVRRTRVPRTSRGVFVVRFFHPMGLALALGTLGRARVLIEWFGSSVVSYVSLRRVRRATRIIHPSARHQLNICNSLLIASAFVRVCVLTVDQSIPRLSLFKLLCVRLQSPLCVCVCLA